MGNVTIFTVSSLIHFYEMVFFFHHHLIGWKSWERAWMIFTVNLLLFHPFYRITYVVKRGEKALTAYTNKTGSAEAEYSLHNKRTFPMIMCKSLKFWCLVFFTLLGVPWSNCWWLHIYQSKKLSIWSPVYPTLKTFTKAVWLWACVSVNKL